MIANILAQGDGQHLNVVLIIGIAIFGGTVGARVFQKLRVPQVVGYVFIGILIGEHVLDVISHETVNNFEPLSFFALGIIGFMVGGELKRKLFVKFGRQVITILVFEGVTAFFLVGISSFVITYLFTDFATAIAIGVVFGAICTATDPASTMQVLWEYKARGAVTKMLTAIVALDDALALVLYALAVSIASVFTGMGEVSFLRALSYSLFEVAGSLVLGVLAGLVLVWIIKRTREHEKVLAFTISFVLLNIGLAKALNFDVILSAMAIGVTMINLAPIRTKVSFDLMRKFSGPVYVLFFVLVGSRLVIGNIDWMVGLLIAAYVLGSVIGKAAGAYWGSKYSKAPRMIKKYLGFCLYPQGGIAVGLLILASHRFSPNIAEILILVVITGVFLLQIIGPVLTKTALNKAGETGMNITEEDLVSMYTVGEVAETDVTVIDAGATMTEILQIVGATDASYYPVVDDSKKLLGAITMAGMRNTFTTLEINDWLIALDILEPVIAKTSSEVELAKAFRKIKELELENLPVLRPDGTISGVLNPRTVHRKLSAILLEKQRLVDAEYGNI